jgi:glycine/sarcosine N-methyltransferase
VTFGDGSSAPGPGSEAAAAPAPGSAAAAPVVEPAADYDRFVDWDKRLAREAPFFRLTFAAHEVHSVIDVGCGTGRHAAMWAGWGLDVVGIDPSESMLAQAAVNAEAAAATIAAAGGSLTLVRGGFGDLARLGLGPTDAVTCTGNALPHVEGRAGLRTAIADFAAVLRPGGVAVLHLLNHDRLLAHELRSMPPVVRESGDGTWVFLRVMDYTERGIGFDFVTLHRPAGAWETGADWDVASRRSVHTALPSSLLRAELEDAGFGDVRLYGDHERRAYQPERDESVIVVAVRS